VKISLRNTGEEVGVLGRKMKIKDMEGYKTVYIRSSKSRIERCKMPASQSTVVLVHPHIFICPNFVHPWSRFDCYEFHYSSFLGETVVAVVQYRRRSGRFGKKDEN
jgi:hypothetical protein